MKLVFRSVGDVPGSRYPAWIRNLVGRCGVYVIRDRRTRRVLYVGESHSGRLYETLTRHFQAWGRIPEGGGVSYHRGDVEAAVTGMGACGTEALQAHLIGELRPRDNELVPAEAAADDIPI